MESKTVPNRRQITVAIMRGSDLDGRLSDLHDTLVEMSPNGDTKEINAMIGSLYKGITDTAFFLGRSFARVLDPSKIKDADGLAEATEKFQSIMDLTNSFMDGVRSIVDGSSSNTDSLFEDIVDGLDLGMPDDTTDD